MSWMKLRYRSFVKNSKIPLRGGLLIGINTACELDEIKG
jgi:hypothetical protein